MAVQMLESKPPCTQRCVSSGQVFVSVSSHHEIIPFRSWHWKWCHPVDHCVRAHVHDCPVSPDLERSTVGLATQEDTLFNAIDNRPTRDNKPLPEGQRTQSVRRSLSNMSW